MEIIIDSREKGRIKEALYYYEDAKVEQLEFGDYVFKDNDKTVAFEFKTCEDYISSIKNKSLFEELANQTDEYDYSFLIVCGKLYETVQDLYLKVPGYSQRNYHTFLNTYYSMTNGAKRRCLSICPVIDVQNTQEAFREMELIAEKCLDNKAYAGVKRSIGKVDPLTHFLCGIGGISTKTCDTIINELEIKTLEDLLKLDKEDYLSVKGIGNKTADKIVKWIK